MSKFKIGCLGVIGLVIIVAIIMFSVFWSHRGEAINLETKIEAQLKSNESNYDSMWKRFTEMTQVTEIQAEQFKDVYTGLIQGRYEDPNLLFKMVQEQNPQLNGEVYTKLQNEISAARIEFDRNQKKLLDVIGEYNRLVQHRGVIMAFITKREKLDSDDYIVTSDRTDNVFESGKDESINLRGEGGK